MRRLRTVLIRLASATLCALPERPLVALAEAAGELWYRIAPDRAARARRNLGRVVAAVSASGHGSTLVRRAAEDPAALERLVRSAFRHAARYYLEVARTPITRPARVLERTTVETPEVVDELVTAGRPMIIVGAHFGAIEVPVVFLAARVGHRIVAPMETVTDPGLQAWIERTRTTAGIRAVPLEHARRELLSELRAGRTVGMVGDRDITGGGLRVTLFGAPASLPIGAALLAVETGAPLLVGGARRVRGGRYSGWLARIDVPTTGSHRERVRALVEETARRFEELVAQAPDQWWAVFQPIWPDLEGVDSALARNTRARPRARRRESAGGAVAVFTAQPDPAGRATGPASDPDDRLEVPA